MHYDFGKAKPRPVDKLPFPGFKVPRRVAIDMGCCVRCGGEAIVFADPLSEAEYNISGLCQHCQNDLFEEDEWA